VEVICSIEYTRLLGDVGMVDSVRAICLRCAHETESFGDEYKSVRRCLALMREECPLSETNFYIAEGGEDE